MKGVDLTLRTYKTFSKNLNIYNPEQNIWNKIEKPSKTGPDKTAITKV